MEIDQIDYELADRFWRAGHNIISNGSFNGSFIVGMRRFKSNFGVCHRACAYVWDAVGADKRPPGSELVNLLYALLFLKVYNTEHQFKAITGRDEKTFRKYAWQWTALLAYDLHTVFFLRGIIFVRSDYI